MSSDFNKYEDYYNSDLNMWIPDEADNVKEVAINFIIAQYSVNDPRNFSENGVHSTGISDIEFLENIVEKTNDLISNLHDPSHNGGQSVCGQCNSVKNTKIKFVLKDIHFIVDPNVNGTTSTVYRYNSNNEINIIAHNANLNYNWALLPSYNFNKDQYVVYNKFYTDYINDIYSAYNIRPRNLAHELGHVLGLCHTHLGGGCANSCSQMYQNGDFFDDHFGTYPGVCPDLTNGWNADPWIADNDQVTNNIMGSCVLYRGYLSSKQIGAIHRNLALKSCRKFVSNNIYNTSSPIIIEDNELWDFSFLLDRDIIVQSGGSLTLSCELFLPLNGSILVNEGGELMLNGGAVYNGNIIINEGGYLALDNDGKILLNSYDNLYIETGATANFTYGDIELIQ